MKWTWTVGRFWGTELRLHISLLLLIPYVVLTFRPTNAGDAIRVALMIVGIFACVTLHEAGHTLAARLFGIEVKSITLWPLGGFASLSRRPEKTLPNLVIVAAGPVTNLILGMVFLVIVLIQLLLLRSLALPDVSYWLMRLDILPIAVSLVIANLSLAFFNLIPIYPLDGGQITRDLLKLAFGEKNADRILIFVSVPLALGVCLLGVLSVDFIMVLTGGILLLSSFGLSDQISNAITTGVHYFTDRGGYYQKKEDFARAIQEYNHLIQKHPDRAGLHLNRGYVYMLVMEYEKAQADMDRAVQLDANNYTAWALRGEVCDLQGQLEQALEYYNKAIQIQPGWAIPYADRGNLYQRMGNLQQAQVDLDKAVALAENGSVVYVLRSILRYQVGNQAGSVEDMEKALHFAPHWMLVFPELFLENFRGHTHWVLEYYNRAVERNPNDHQAYQGRADALRVNERFDWAIEDYHRAIHYAPGQAVLYLNRGQMYQKLGIADKAAEDYRKAVKLADQDHIRSQAQQMLLTLPGAAAAAPNQPDGL